MSGPFDMVESHRRVLDGLMFEAEGEGSHGHGCRCTMCDLLLEVLNGLLEPTQEEYLAQFIPLAREVYEWVSVLRKQRLSDGGRADRASGEPGLLPFVEEETRGDRMGRSRG